MFQFFSKTNLIIRGYSRIAVCIRKNCQLTQIFLLECWNLCIVSYHQILFWGKLKDSVLNRGYLFQYSGHSIVYWSKSLYHILYKVVKFFYCYNWSIRRYKLLTKSVHISLKIECIYFAFQHNDCDAFYYTFWNHVIRMKFHSNVTINLYKQVTNFQMILRYRYTVINVPKCGFPLFNF